MPGTIIRTATRSGPVNPPMPESARYFVVGQFERGPIDGPQLVRSAAELERYFGTATGYSAAYSDLVTYFEEGGSEALAIRVVGATATAGSVTLNDRAGAPLATLKINAANPGGWSSRVSVRIGAGKLAATYALEVLVDGLVVEKYDNLASSAAAVGAIAGAPSRFIRAVDLGAATTGASALPAVGTFVLSAGNDQRATITAADMTAALDLLGDGYGGGVVAIPGYSADLVGEALKAHTKETNRLGLLAAPIGSTEAEETALADELIAADGEYLGLIAPWVRVPSSATTSKLISPEGYAAAMRARAHRDAGPWRPAAGEVAIARYVLGPERAIGRAEGDRLDDAGVSAIRTIAGTTRLYGWRSLSDDLVNYALLTGRDTLNYVSHAVEAALEPLVFQPIDGRGHFLGRIETAVLGVLEPLRKAEALYPATDEVGVELDPGYSVDVGPTVNTPALLAANRAAVVAGVRISPVGAVIEALFVKAGLTAAV